MKQRLDAVETAEHSRKSQQRRGRFAVFRKRGDGAKRFGHELQGGLVAQVAIFLKQTQVIESARHQRLQSAPVYLQIFRRVHARLFRLAHRFRARRAKGDDQNVRPGDLHLFEKLARFFGAQVKKEQRRASLLQDHVQPARFRDMPHLGDSGEKRLHPANQIGILGIKYANRRRHHAAATSSANLTSGNMM